MRIGVPLWAQSVLRRPAAAVSLVVVAALATAAAASGPMLLRAVEQSALRSALMNASAASTDVLVRADERCVVDRGRDFRGGIGCRSQRSVRTVQRADRDRRVHRCICLAKHSKSSVARVGDWTARGPNRWLRGVRTGRRPVSVGWP